MKTFKHFSMTALFVIAPVSMAADDHMSGHDMSQMGNGSAMPQMTGPMDAVPLSVGEIRKVDKSTGKVTIKHGPLVNLDMMPMTMVFRVKDASWLDQMKAGDKIRFRAESINGALTVVRYEQAN